MAFGVRLKIDAVREIAFGSITGSFTAIGGATTDHTRIFRITNSTDVDVYISIDGINNNYRMAASTFLLIDISANGSELDDLFLAVGTIFYVKQAGGAPSSGAVWIEIMSADRGV